MSALWARCKRRMLSYSTNPCSPHSALFCHRHHFRTNEKDINHLEWVRSEQLLDLLATAAESGPSGRCHLLRTGTLGSLMSMCLGDDSPYPELVQSPRPRRRRVSGADASSPASPRRPYRSSFSPLPDVGGGSEAGGGRGTHRGGRGTGQQGAAHGVYAKRNVREVRPM